LNQRVGIVVPTLGRRPEYLIECLNSIRASGEAHIVLVTPIDFDTAFLRNEGLIDQQVDDPGIGLSEAINAGVAALPESVRYTNWLGDDDLLALGSLSRCADFLDKNPDAVMVFGSCEYIDPTGNRLWKNKSGPWAVPLLRFGPDLIPQPGALFRCSAFNEVGGLDSRWGWAFDFDLFIKLSKIGQIKFLDETLASFRWHPESLSVEFRKQSVLEASRVRVSHLPTYLRPISALWEYPVRQATLLAGAKVTGRAPKKALAK
jgi:hypothetical protein